MEDRFALAQSRVKRLARKPENEQLLELYALFKQGTIGDCQGKRPGMLDIRGRAKFDAWSKKRGMDKQSAQDEYVTLVEGLERSYGLSDG